MGGELAQSILIHCAESSDLATYTDIQILTKVSENMAHPDNPKNGI
jgi:hypothetical protein